jgi:glutaredoxin-like YruB-family protein
MAKVIIYTTPTCVYCKMAKEFFKENKIDYLEIDVSSDEKGAKEMIEKSGQMGVPVIIIKDQEKEKIIVGFQKEEILKVLNL